jgi:RNA polymerase sigma-70 factor, ECF subfamily
VTETENGMTRRLLEAPGNSDRDSRLVQMAVTRAKAGDAEGIHFLYARFAPGVKRYVDSILHDQHESEDITQMVFAKLMTRIGKYEQREVPFTAWIMRVARNAALDHLRASRAVPTEEVRLSASPDPGGSDRLNDLRVALEELPKDQRDVLILRHIAGLSPLEIADTLGKSESSIHGLHHRGRRALRQKLTELGAGPTVATS